MYPNRAHGPQLNGWAVGIRRAGAGIYTGMERPALVSRLDIGAGYSFTGYAFYICVHAGGTLLLHLLRYMAVYVKGKGCGGVA